MEKFTVNYRTAKKLVGKTLEDLNNNVEYFFDMATVRSGRDVFLLEMAVDGYLDGKWSEDHSGSYMAGETLLAEDAPWVKLV